MMKNQRKLWMCIAAGSALALAGCFGDDNNETPGPPQAPAEVPASAGVSVASFVSYILSLSPTDESSEPLVITSAFAVPADEASEPTPLP